jgi:signal transduction histidine kinase
MAIDYQCTDAGELPRLPGRIEVALYRIAQEALTNVRRHAKARQASVVLLQQPGEVTLLVEDDGIGFDPSSVQETTDTSLGLTGMEERATLLGGSFVLESAAGSGTVVRVSIPVGRETKCQSES